MTKTNAMRLLDNLNVSYSVHEYDASDGKIDGVSVALKTNMPLEIVYKTIVAVSSSNNYYVFILPVEDELDLKLAAKSVSEKSIALLKLSELTKVTGYVRGGCSPFAMKKQFVTVLHEACLLLDTIVVSGGKIGLQIKLAPDDLIAALNAKTADLCAK